MHYFKRLFSEVKCKAAFMYSCTQTRMHSPTARQTLQ